MSAELYFYFKKNPLQFMQVSGLNVMVNNEKTFNIKANMEVAYEITAGKCKIQMSMPYLGSETGIANIELDVKDGDRILLTYKSPITVFANGAILVNKKNCDNYINWEDGMSNDRYKMLKVFEHAEWLEGCPIRIEKSKLLLDNQKNQITLQVKMFNLSEKVIRAVYLDIECFDDDMDYVTKYIDIPYQGLNVFPQASFGDRQENYFEESNIGNVKIIISKVVFEDDKVWANNHLGKDYLLEEKKKHDELEPIHIHAEKEHKKSRAIIISTVIYYILLIVFYIKSISMLQENGYNLSGLGKKVVIIAFIVPIIIFTIYKIVISKIRQKKYKEQ